MAAEGLGEEVVRAAVGFQVVETAAIVAGNWDSVGANSVVAKATANMEVGAAVAVAVVARAKVVRMAKPGTFQRTRFLLCVLRHLSKEEIERSIAQSHRSPLTPATRNNSSVETAHLRFQDSSADFPKAQVVCTRLRYLCSSLG